MGTIDTIPRLFLMFGQFCDISLTAVKFPNISRFTKQMVILCVMQPVCSWSV